MTAGRNNLSVQYACRQCFQNTKNIHSVKSVQIWSFSGPCFPVFGLNTGKHGPGKTPYLYSFHAVISKKRNTNFLKNGINHANVDFSVTLLVTFCDYAILLTINYITFIVKSSCQFRKSIFQVLRKFLEQIFSNGYRRLHMKQLNLENCLWIKDKRYIETLIWFFFVIY